MFKYFLLIMSISCALFINAQQVTIKGNAKSYAGDTLVWKSYQDLITLTEQTLAKCKVDENGNFEFKFNTTETIQTFIHLNVFKGFLFVEPNKVYEIVLPKKTKKLPEDELNPFFKESDFYIRILNAEKNELNNQIKKFDKLYDEYMAKHFKQFTGRVSKTIVDSIVDAIDKNVDNNSAFFRDYKSYNYASLRLLAYERNKEKIIKKYYYNKAILYQNPAYMNLFNQLFNNYLAVLYKTPEGKKIPYFLVRHRSLTKIKSVMDSIAYLNNDTLQEMIICKSLYDNFYKDDFPKQAIIAVVDSVKEFGITLQNQQIANNILNDITNLLVGYAAPDFELPDKYNKMYGLSKFKRKFVYLNFVNPNSYTCLQELELLKSMYAKKYDKLKIVSICVCDNIEQMKQFVKENAYKWQFLYYAKNHELLRKYNVKVYPTYYMINPEGELAMSPAFPPSEDSFEARYFDMLKSWNRELQRKKATRRGN